jgi:hypothetical protein
VKGLPREVDWAQFTKENRILDNEKPYRETGEPWQFEIDQAINDHQRVYLQLARGHDKTDRYAWWSLLWLSTTVASRGYCVGVDADNAALFRDSSKKLCALHPELFRDIDIQKKIVLNKKTGSWIETISSDVDSAYGLNFDLLIVNDFHAWPDKAFWEVLWTACFKKPGIRVWLESNALTYGEEDTTWKYDFRKWVRDKGVNIKEGDGKWFFFCPPKFLAGWQSSALNQWKETLHPAQYNRLINNIDTTGEASFVTEEQVNAISTIAPTPNLSKREGIVATGIDLGIKKDSTAIATVQSVPVLPGRPAQLRLLALDVLSGSSDDPLSFRLIEETYLDHVKRYHSNIHLADPWNAAALIQKHSRLQEWAFTTAHVRELTQILYRVIADKQFLIYPKAGRAIQKREEWDLQRELVQAVVKEMSYGNRIDHQSGGFSDRIMAVGMCIHYLMSEGNLPKQKQTSTAHEDSWSKKIIADWDKPQQSILRI